MAHTVTTGEFQGPLGLLLELVERNQLEVTSISVADITAQYLEHIRSLEVSSPENLSEFLQLGARLLYIKSLALLPAAADTDEQGQELQRLSSELAEYRRFQVAARALESRAAHRTWERPVAERLSPSELPLPNVTLQQLANAFTAALRQTEPLMPSGVMPARLSLQTAVSHLQRRLPGGFQLSHLLAGCRNRLEIVVTFLALLELIRDGSAQVRQSNQFEPIVVEPAQETPHA